MNGKFTVFLLFPQLLFVILFGVFVKYDDSTTGGQSETKNAESTEFNQLYPS